jgi:hypothetical protein
MEEGVHTCKSSPFVAHASIHCSLQLWRKIKIRACLHGPPLTRHRDFTIMCHEYITHTHTHTHSAEKEVRRQAAAGLGIVSKRNDVRIIKVLSESCKDREAIVREAAIRSLVAVDSGSKDDPSTWTPAQSGTLESLGKCMQDADAQVRAAATQCELVCWGVCLYMLSS